MWWEGPMTINEAMRRLDPVSALSVLTINLIPVFGVLGLGWSAVEILMLFWAENVLIGLAALVRVLTAAGGDSRAAARLGLGLFFLVHYGIFCAVHGAMAAALVVLPGQDAGVIARTFESRDFQISVAITGLLLLIGLVRDWWISGDWRRFGPREEMGRPYGRVLILHVTLIFGAGALTMLEAPGGAILILCLAKAAAELWAMARRDDDEAISPGGRTG